MAKKPRLFDLTAELLELEEGLASDDPEIEQQCLDGIELTAENYQEKCAGYIDVLDRLAYEQGREEAEAKLLKQMADAHAKAAKVRKNAADRLKARLEESFQALGISEVRTDAGKLKRQKSQQRVVVDNDRLIPRRWFVPIEPRLDKGGLKRWMKEHPDEKVDGVHLEQGWSIRIYR